MPQQQDCTLLRPSSEMSFHDMAYGPASPQFCRGVMQYNCFVTAEPGQLGATDWGKHASSFHAEADIVFVFDVSALQFSNRTEALEAERGWLVGRSERVCWPSRPSAEHGLGLTTGRYREAAASLGSAPFFSATNRALISSFSIRSDLSVGHHLLDHRIECRTLHIYAAYYASVVNKVSRWQGVHVPRLGD